MGIERGLEITDRIRAYSKMQDLKGEMMKSILSVFSLHTSLFTRPPYKNEA